MIRLGGLRYSLLVLYLPCMTDFYEELVTDLDAIGVEVEKAKMSRSEAGRYAANARWGNKGGAPKMVEGGWRSAAGIPAGEQKSNARSKAGMQGARTRAQNKADDSGKQLRDELAAEGVPEKTLAHMEKYPTGKIAQQVMNDRRKRKAQGDAIAPESAEQEAMATGARSPRAVAGRKAAEARFKDNNDLLDQAYRRKKGLAPFGKTPTPAQRAQADAEKKKASQKFATDEAKDAAERKVRGAPSLFQVAGLDKPKKKKSSSKKMS